MIRQKLRVLKGQPIIVLTITFMLLDLLVFGQSCSGAPSVPTLETPAAPNSISISNFRFVPDPIEVPVGTTVKWTNKDPVIHAMASDTNLFRSPSMSTGDTFSYTFNEAGTFEYHCGPHPSMKGMVIVK